MLLLGTILPYDPEPLRVSALTPVTCEVWFLEESEEVPATATPAHLWPDVTPSLAPHDRGLQH
jgi:hypothetical protein